MEKKDITKEDLAQMVAKGFENTATKDDIARLDERLDSIEGFMRGHDNRIERLEDNMRQVKTKLEL